MPQQVEWASHLVVLAEGDLRTAAKNFSSSLRHSGQLGAQAAGVFCYFANVAM